MLPLPLSYLLNAGHLLDILLELCYTLLVEILAVLEIKE